MKTVIETRRSKLNIYNIKEVIDDTNIVKLCVDEVKEEDLKEIAFFDGLNHPMDQEK